LQDKHLRSLYGHYARLLIPPLLLSFNALLLRKIRSILRLGLSPLLNDTVLLCEVCRVFHLGLSDTR
jgi:hypothetical protein